MATSVAPLTGKAARVSVPERKLTDDLLRALADADALDQFQALPLEEQKKFSAWIARSEDEVSYRRRIEILVTGMQMAPRITPPPEPRSTRGFWTDPKP